MKDRMIKPRALLGILALALPIVLVVGMVVLDQRRGSYWLARDGRDVISVGDAEIVAPIPFHGTLWSVRAVVSEAGGWETALRVPRHPTDLWAMIGLHPDLYERGRSTRVVVTTVVWDGTSWHSLGAITLLPGRKTRERPFRPVSYSLNQWQGQRIRVRMMARSEGTVPVEVFWIEPRLQPSGQRRA